MKGMCYIKMGNKKHATDLFERVVLIDPDFVASLNNLGNMAMNKKEYDRSILFYNKSKASSLRLT